MKIIDKRTASVLVINQANKDIIFYIVPPDAAANDAGSFGIDVSKLERITVKDGGTVLLAVPSGSRIGVGSTIQAEYEKFGRIATLDATSVFDVPNANENAIITLDPVEQGDWIKATIKGDL